MAALTAVPAGCASWPDNATGGLAELYPSSSGRLNELERRYVALVNSGIADIHPALLVEARGYLIRAKREKAGGLAADSELSADRVEDILRRLESRWTPATRHARWQ
ncbi:MAG: hypothetical protein R3D27_06800 [Hyphomicrobiaceae bacterium]